MLFSSHLPKRPCLRWSGYQVTSSLAASTSSLRAVVRTYQERLGVVDERRVAAPAERVAVLVGLAGEQEAARFQVVHDAGVGVLDEHARPGRDLGGEAAFQVHGHDHRQVVLLADDHVVGAEGRGDVDDAGPLVGGHEVGGDDPPGRLVGLHELVDGGW